jgi:hypothetical protein
MRKYIGLRHLAVREDPSPDGNMRENIRVMQEGIPSSQRRCPRQKGDRERNGNGRMAKRRRKGRSAGHSGTGT